MHTKYVCTQIHFFSISMQLSSATATATATAYLYETQTMASVRVDFCPAIWYPYHVFMYLHSCKKQHCITKINTQIKREKDTHACICICVAANCTGLTGECCANKVRQNQQTEKMNEIDVAPHTNTHICAVACLQKLKLTLFSCKPPIIDYFLFSFSTFTCSCSIAFAIVFTFAFCALILFASIYRLRGAFIFYALQPTLFTSFGEATKHVATRCIHIHTQLHSYTNVISYVYAYLQTCEHSQYAHRTLSLLTLFNACAALARCALKYPMGCHAPPNLNQVNNDDSNSQMTTQRQLWLH